MRYCVNHRKFISALSPLDMTICVDEKHEIIEYTFEQLYNDAQRKGELAAKGCKLMGICKCHYKTTNCCQECKR